MAKVNIDAYRTAGRPFRVAIEENATIGATVGLDLVLGSSVTLLSGTVLPTGYVVKASDILNGLIPTATGSQAVGSDWSQITNIPANVAAVASLGTVGLVTRRTGGTWVTRALSLGAGLSGSNLDGDAGDPSLGHADTSSVSDLTSNNSDGVVIQDFTVTFDTFGHVQTVTVGTVDLDTRYAQKQALSVTGSRGGNAALASLLTQLASLGLITDNTTA